MGGEVISFRMRSWEWNDKADVVYDGWGARLCLQISVLEHEGYDERDTMERNETFSSFFLPFLWQLGIIGLGYIKCMEHLSVRASLVAKIDITTSICYFTCE